MIIESLEIKEKYFNLLKNELHIPVCKNCKKLFNLGFPKNEEALCDYLICVANNLVCTCENLKKVESLYLSKGDGSLDITQYYEQIK